jgi:hypothetical protein
MNLWVPQKVGNLLTISFSRKVVLRGVSCEVANHQFIQGNAVSLSTVSICTCGVTANYQYAIQNQFCVIRHYAC